jgi:hypothetical protein
MIGSSVLVLLGASGKAVAVGIVLSGTSYTETFDGLAGGLPAGWSVKTGATSAALGSDAAYVATATSWATTTGNFRNAASADGLTSGASAAAQSGSADRALAIRQTATFGDPGAAFMLSIQDTLGFENFSLSFKAQMLSVQDRSTTWTIDYRLGASGAFTSLGTYADPGVFGSTTRSFNATQLSAWNDQAQPVYFRIAALSAATGTTGSRDTFGIDDFSLSFSAVRRAVPDATLGALWLGPVFLMLRAARHGRR